MWNTFPLFGSTLLLAVMVMASYTFAVSLSAGATGRVRTLHAARLGAYGTVALIAVSVVCLAYAFVSHDFRLRYVAHYSDRGMPTLYLLTALWGGQDGSLLWWLFLLSGYIGVCVYSLGKKHLDLQPYIIATLMAVVIFFGILMGFAANPFSTSVSGARTDGEGLNPLLQNFYMIIHPPSLYIGFVGCTIPFAFAIAALATGKLDAEWIRASRKFTLFALLFLAIGNTLGMLWAYEELGWGGYWAWDPVENAAFMPLLVIGAFAHSVMIQERRGMLKVWNVFLICLTFFMTIFGTFLTRSGAIASVHSFAQSSIGTYFVWFLVVVAVFCSSLIMYRWPELRAYPPTMRLRRAALASGWLVILALAPGALFLSGRLVQLSGGLRVAIFALVMGLAVFASIELVFRRMTRGLTLTSARPEIESVFSREFTFLLNNFGLLGMMAFILVATTFPMVSEALWNEKVTVGPPYYNAWMQPLGLIVFLLMGVGTLFGWKKTSPDALKRAFVVPVAVASVVMVIHVTVGPHVGFPAIVWAEPIYGGFLGSMLRAFNAFTPLLGFGLAAFNIAVIVQEFVLLLRSRRKSGADKTPGVLWYLGFLPGFIYTLFSLPPAGRRRYGGYIVHLGIVLMFIGFTGKSWTVDRETSLQQGQTYKIDRLSVQYVGPRMEVDNNKRMIFADVRVLEDGKEIGKLAPAKFIYKKSPEAPTTEVAMLHSIRDDLYLVVGSINPESKVASLQIHLNPLVGWIWFGCIILIFGSVACMWPELEPEESRVWQFARGAGAIATSITIGVVIALMPVPAFAQATASQHAGSIEIHDAKEKSLFTQLRCMCGTCPRELLSSCACSTADASRERLRLKLARGESVADIVKEYTDEFGTEALSIPPNEGATRLIYGVPVMAIAGAGFTIGFAMKRWRGNSKEHAKTRPDKTKRDALDDKIDEELKDLDG